jgi:hypothetical protein
MERADRDEHGRAVDGRRSVVMTRARLAQRRFVALMAAGVALGACSFPRVFSPESREDVVAESSSDGATDVALFDVVARDASDAAMDVAMDAAPDAAPDAASDAAPDVLRDVPMDTVADVAREAATDAGSTCGASDAGDASSAPRVQWARNWGGPGDQGSTGGGAMTFGEGGEVITDASGNVYVISSYLAGIEIAGMPFTATRYATLLIKYSPSGALLWVKNFHTMAAAGSSDFSAADLFWDAATDEVVVIAKGFGGEARINNVVVGAGALTECPAIVRFAAGSGEMRDAFVFSTSSNWSARAFARTPRDTVLIAGPITAPTPLPGGTMAMPVGAGSRDALIVEWNYRTNSVVNHWVIGGAADEDVNTVAELPGGDIVIGGKMSSALPTTVGGIGVPASDGFDGFYARFTRAGAVQAYRLLRGPGNGTLVHRIVLGPSGDYYLSGLYDGSVEYDPAAMRSLSGTGNGGYVARVASSTNAIQWFVGQTNGGNGFFGVRRIVVDACEQVHGAFTASASDSFARFAGASLNPAGGALNPHSFVFVLRGADGAVDRLDRMGSPAGFFATHALALLPDGRHVIKGDLSGSLTVDGHTFASPGGNIDQFAVALTF